MNKQKLIEFYNALQAMLVHGIAFEDIYFNLLTKDDYQKIFFLHYFDYSVMRDIFKLSHIEFEYVFSEKWKCNIGDSPEVVLERLSTLIDSGVPNFWDVTTCEFRVKDSSVINF